MIMGVVEMVVCAAQWPPRETLSSTVGPSEVGREPQKHTQRGAPFSTERSTSNARGDVPLSCATSLKSVPWISAAMPTSERRSASLDDANSIFCFTFESSGDLIGADRTRARSRWRLRLRSRWRWRLRPAVKLAFAFAVG